MDMRILLIALILAFSIAGLANSLWFGLELRRFTKSTPVLSSDLHLARYKKLVAHQMHAALLQIVLLSAPIVITVVGIVSEILEPGDIFFVIVPAVPILLVGFYFRSWEVKTRNIPTATPGLEEERDAVVRTWLRKARPDW